jgi:hypothetical protein
MNDFQQLFLRWLDQTRRKIAVEPLFDGFDGRSMFYRFEQLVPNIALVVSPKSICVNVYRNAVVEIQPWDTLFKRQACTFQPCRLEGYSIDGFACVTVDHDHECIVREQVSEETTVAHCFEPLTKWIVEKLAPAHWLLFMETGNSECASLQVEDELETVSSEEDCPCERIEIRKRRRARPALISMLGQRRV